jgi:hypothetical protein
MRMTRCSNHRAGLYRKKCRSANILRDDQLKDDSKNPRDMVTYWICLLNAAAALFRK